MHKYLKNTNVPVFGDVHGNLIGMLNTLSKMQIKNSETYDIVLQVGDMGFFRNIEALDEASRRRMSKSNPLKENSASIIRHLNSDDIYENFFVKPEGFEKLSCKIYFIRGNHEEHSYLLKLDDITQLDKYGVINYLPDSRRLNLGDAQTNISVMGIGGIDPTTRPNSYRKNPLISHSINSFNDTENYSGIDLLLLHQGPEGNTKGSTQINDFIEATNPKMVIHGHGHDNYSESQIGNTKILSLGLMSRNNNPSGLNFMGVLDTKSLNFRPGY